MGDNTQTSTSTTGSSDPKVKETVDQLLGGIQGVWGKGPQVYGHSLFQPAGQGTQNAWAASNANANGLLQGGGLNGTQRNALTQLTGVGQGYGQLGDNNGLTTAQSQAQGRLGSLYGGYGQLGDQNGLTGGQQRNVNTANSIGGQYGALGKNYAAGNPFFEADLAHTNDQVGSAVNSAIGAGGRFGSGYHVNQLGSTLANTDNAARMQQRNTAFDQQNAALQGQLGASGQAFGEQQQGVGNQFGALAGQQGVEQGLFNNAQTGVGNQFNSLAGRGANAAQQFGFGQQAIGNQQNALGQLGAVGAAQDANAQGQLLGNANLWDAQHNGNLNLLGQLSSILNGTAGQAGTTTTATEPGTPWWQQLLGVGATGAGIYGKLTGH